MWTWRRVRHSTWTSWLWRQLNRRASPTRAQLQMVLSRAVRVPDSKKDIRRGTTYRSTSRSICRVRPTEVAKKVARRCAMEKCSYNSWNRWTKAYSGVAKIHRMINLTTLAIRLTTAAAKCFHHCHHKCLKFRRCTTCKTYQASHETTSINSLIITATAIPILSLRILKANQIWIKLTQDICRIRYRIVSMFQRGNAVDRTSSVR